VIDSKCMTDVSKPVLRHLLEGRVFLGGGQVKRQTPNPHEIQGLS